MKAGFRSGHWGLPGMRERANKMRGELRVVRPKEGGTEIELQVPACHCLPCRQVQEPLALESFPAKGPGGGLCRGVVVEQGKTCPQALMLAAATQPKVFSFTARLKSCPDTKQSFLCNLWSGRFPVHRTLVEKTAGPSTALRSGRDDNSVASRCCCQGSSTQNNCVGTCSSPPIQVPERSGCGSRNERRLAWSRSHRERTPPPQNR